ncbi:MAG: TraB/VirB10 family protein [Proteobacteria bacterium]|nr:TraB/VirB10 family protein [Pseudomonadota bacterium]
MQAKLKEYVDLAKKWWVNNKDKHKYVYLGGSALALLLVYAASKGMERETYIFQSKDQVSFEGGKILGSTDSIYKRRDQLLSKSVKDLEAKQTATDEKFAGVESRLSDILNRLSGAQQPPTETQTTPQQNYPQPSTDPNIKDPGYGNPQQPNSTESYPTQQFYRERSAGMSPSVGGGSAIPRILPKGPATISFPVKEAEVAELGVVIPSGSYVKAKMMTGVEAPEGKNYPVLLQLDYAFIGPNKTKIDLTGCFGISKAQGDLSTERVQMQLVKISCVSQKGKMFEREVNGFVADDADNSFAVMGAVSTKQDRVAATAFISSVVEGVGKAIQQAQTTQSTNALGGGQALVTGDQAKYIGAGGASNAATMVTQWYLQQANRLLPTINVGSGQDIWVVMQDKVELPNWYFRKADSQDKSVYSYFTKIAE